MPQRCRGLEDPAGGPTRPCIFSTEDNGTPSVLVAKRDGSRCAFCCPDAFARAWRSQAGRGNITARLAKWRQKASPCYEAVFTFGIPGLCLSNQGQQDLRRRAGELRRWQRSSSWLHKKKERLETFLCGKAIPKAPQLSQAGHHFLWQCRSRVRNTRGLAKELRPTVWKYGQLRALEPRASKKVRRLWWRLRRQLKQRLLPFAALGPPVLAAIAWAIDEKIIDPQTDFRP